MQLKANMLSKHLKQKQLAPCYLISGDDSFLCQESATAIKHTLEKRGFAREHHVMSPSFSWQHLEDSLNHLDLFSDSQYIELSNPNAKFDVNGSKVITSFLDNPPSDKILLIITERLSPQQKKSAWYKAIEKNGAVIAIWPLKHRELITWIQNTLSEKGLTADHQSVALLAQFSSGNVFAAHQAIQKLVLWKPNAHITVDMMHDVLCSHATYNPFEWMENVLLGATKQALFLFDGMRETNQEITLVTWSLTNELKQLYSISQAMRTGQSQAQALKNVWQSKQAAYQKALRRLSRQRIRDALTQSIQIDLIMKGQIPGNPWEAIERLSLSLCQKEPIMAWQA